MPLQFSTTKDGHLAVRIRHLTLALLTGDNGQLFRADCYPAKNPADCNADDFSSRRPVEDENAFRAYAQDLADHYDEADRIGRRAIAGGVIPTPWGASQSRTFYGEGVESVTTEGHGGFLLDLERNEQIAPEWRSSDGTYEEDEEWAIVAFHFPNLFTAREKRYAEETLKNWRPDIWMKLTGRTIDVSESWVLRQRAFREDNAQNFIVIAALRSTKHQGQVECHASIGGARGTSATSTTAFLVPSDEYKNTEFGFIIDETQHPRLDAEGNPLPLPSTN